MLNYIDLRPILVHPQAAEILLLARGQLNRAFRSHGLIPPDPMVPSYAGSIDPTELDDPAAHGIDHAMAKFQNDFVAWAGAMPVKLAPPVLDILRKAQEALDESQDAANVAAIALRRAFDFLSGCLPSDCSHRDTSGLGVHAP
jgi:hypothetical protein